jgi:hypothetical protein
MAKTLGNETVGESARLGPVGIQDSHVCQGVIQALDGSIRFDGRPMGENEASVSWQAGRSRPERQG